MLTLHVFAQEGASFMSDRLCIRACCTLGESCACVVLTVSLSTRGMNKLSNYGKQGPTTKHFPNKRIWHRNSLFGVKEEKGTKEADIKEDHLIFNIWIKDYLLLQPFLSD